MPKELGFGQFAEKTKMGLEALFASVSKVTSEPERAAFAVAADVAAMARLFRWNRISDWVEPVVLPLLVGTVLRSDTESAEKVALTGALASAATNRAGKVKDVTSPSAVATAASVGTYAGYAGALRRQNPRLSKGALVRAGVVLGGAVIAYRRNRDVIPATLLGGAAMVYATDLAQDPKISEYGNIHTEGVSHGANLLVASEVLTGLQAVGVKNRLVDATASLLSSIGHMLLVDGLARR